MAEVAPAARARPPGAAARAPALDRGRVRATRSAATWPRPTRRSPPTTPARRPTCVARPGRVDRDRLAEQAGGEPGRSRRTRCGCRRRRPGRAGRGPGRAGRRAGRGQPAVRARAHPGPAGRSGHRWLDLCAGPGGKAALLGRPRPPAAGRTAVAAERAPHRAGLVARGGRAAPPVRPSVLAGGRDAPPLAAGLGRPGAGRRALHRARRAAAAPRGALAAYRGRPGRADRLQRALLPAASTPPARAASSPTSSARRTWPRPATWSSDVLADATADLIDAGPYFPRRPDRPALAAPARHRRDVLRPAPAPADRPPSVGWPGAPRIAPSLLSADFARLAEAAAAVPGLRLAARRRDGQPLRAEPDDRPAGRAGAAEVRPTSRSTATS